MTQRSPRLLLQSSLKGVSIGLKRGLMTSFGLGLSGGHSFFGIDKSFGRAPVKGVL